VREHGPWRAEVWAKGQHDEDAGLGHLFDQRTEKLQRGGIDPMQVFHHKEDGLLFCFLPQPGQQGFKSFLLLPLGSEGERGVMVW
jgi:hypothetical protein